MRKLRQLFLTGLLALVSIPMFAEKGEMKAKLRDGTTVSVELVNGMQSTVWTLHEDGASLNLMVYTGRILNDETGKPYEDPGDPGVPHHVLPSVHTGRKCRDFGIVAGDVYENGNHQSPSGNRDQLAGRPEICVIYHRID